MLKQAAAGGQGISSFVDVPAEEVPADFEDYYQDGDEDPTLLGDVSGIDYDDQPHDDDQEVAGEAQVNETDYHEYDTSHENIEGGQGVQEVEEAQETQEAQEGYEQYEQYEQYDEADQGEYQEYGEEETDTLAAHADAPDNVPSFEATAVPDGAAEITVVDSTDKAVDESAVKAGGGDEEEHGEGSNVESVASSTTLHADHANEAVGEYKDEDLIDWDETILTSYDSEHNTDDNDDFSTFLTEPDLEETELQALTGDEVAEEDSARDAGAIVQEPAVYEHNVHDVNGYGPTPNAVESNAKVDGVSHALDEGAEQTKSVEAAETYAGQAVGTGDRQSESLNKADASVEGTHDQALKHTDLPRDTLEAPELDSGHPIEDSPAKESARNDEDYIDFDEEDDIDFDDDTYEQHEARRASQAKSPSSQSPPGKRPLDETDGIDFTEQPDLKKVKSS
jgi:hypothetical protein